MKPLYVDANDHLNQIFSCFELPELSSFSVVLKFYISESQEV